jgi:hypothetical protein
VLGAVAALAVATFASTAPGAGAATRRKVPTKIVKTTKATKSTKPTLTTPPAPASVPDTTVAPPTVAAATLTAPVIETLEPTVNGARIVFAAPAEPGWFARVAVTSVGRERVAFGGDGAPGETVFTIARPFDPDTQYTVRAAWVRGAAVGPTMTRVVPPTVPQPLNRDRPPVAGPGWTSLLAGDFTPTRRNPCAPWRIVYDSRNQPLAFEASVAQAIAALRVGTGLDIIDGGVVTGRVTDPLAIVISWDTAANATLGVARQVYKRDAQNVVWRTSGSIALAGRRRGITPERWYAVLLHELGHIFGLDHSHDETSLMYSPIESGANWPYVASIYTDADRAGLQAQNAKMTGGGCTTQLDDPDAAKPIT